MAVTGPYLWHNKKSGIFYAATWDYASRRTKMRSLGKDEAAARAEFAKLPGGRAKSRLTWPHEEMAALPGCEKSKVAYALSGYAEEILTAEAERFAWLLTPKPKQGILAALGRLRDPVNIRGAADQICRRRSPLLQALKFLRQARNPRPGPPPQFYRVILDSINRFYDDYPDSHEDAGAVLQGLAFDVRASRKAAA